MKFLTFSDLHEDFDQLKLLLKRAKEDDIDFVIVAGDFTNFERSLRAVLKRLNDLGKTVYVIPGNHEEDGDYETVIKDYPNCINIDRQAVELGEYVIMAYGGDGFSTTDTNFRQISRKWYGNYKNKKTILVTHGPPFGTLLDKLKSKHVGNKDYRKFIERIKPKLAISGHIHETMGEIDTVGDTKCINPCWEGMIIELS